MPIFQQTTSVIPAQPAPALPSLKDRAYAIGKDVALSYAAPYVDIYSYARWLMGKREAPLSFPASGDPWIGYQAPSRYSDLRIYGQQIHPGAILTHCTVEERTEYQERPLQDFEQVAYDVKFPKYSVDGVQYVEVPAATVGKKSIPLSPEAAEVSRRALADAKRGAKDRKSTSNVETIEAGRQAAAAQLQAVSDAQGKDRALKVFQKTYISDFKPRRCELRFILQDLIEETPTQAKMVASRYAVLDHLRTSFVQNPKGAEVVSPGSDLKSTATFINLRNLAGRLVELDLEGLRPYGVTKWVCTMFRHQEVPDVDQIAVQVVLVEYEAIFSSSFPKPGGVKQYDSPIGPQPAPVPPAPAEETRPPLAEFDPGAWKL